jgi:hypothetical protein
MNKINYFDYIYDLLLAEANYPSDDPRSGKGEFASLPHHKKGDKPKKPQSPKPSAFQKFIEGNPKKGPTGATIRRRPFYGA